MKQTTFNNKIVASITAVMVVLGLIIVCAVFYQTGSIPGLNEDAKVKEKSLQRQFIEAHTIEGGIFDRSGYTITKATKPGVPAVVTHNEAYSYLVGYNSPMYSKSGLRDTYSEYLFNGGKDDVGAELKLTIDSALQEFAYELLGKEEGSISIINSKTGEILALASRSAKTTGLNVNSLNKDTFNSYLSYDSFFVNRATMAQDPPGSTFKVITAASMLENKMSKYTFVDNGEFDVSGFKIHNYGKHSYGKTDLQKALNTSQNTYFASAGLELGGAKLQATAERFMFNKPIELDFCTLKSNFSLNGNNDSKGIVQNAFGQGTVIVSPLHMAMVMQGVMNDGIMLKPYVVETITNDRKIILEGKREELSKVLDHKNAKQLKELLHETAEGYGFDKKTYGYVIAKTGTAETAKKGVVHKYLVLGVEINDNEYAICIDNANITSNHDLKNKASELLKYLGSFKLNEVNSSEDGAQAKNVEGSNANLIGILTTVVVALIVLNVVIEQRNKQSNQKQSNV